MEITVVTLVEEQMSLWKVALEGAEGGGEVMVLEVLKVLACLELGPLVAYSEDGLGLIATQIGKPLMLYAYTSSMCGEAWGRINFAHALIEVSSESDLKKEVVMAFPNDDETDYTREVISVEYKWQPPSDGITEVKRKKHKDKKADMHPRSRQIKGIRLDKPKPSFYWQKKGTTRRGADMDTTAKDKVKGPSTSKSFDALNTLDIDDEYGTSSSRSNQVEDQETRHKVSQLNEHVESDDEVDEFIFPEGDKFGDKFDIRQKG
ncbi:hypothetical protein Tco_0941219 [Tanacetum coccineum]|uniref:Uncharacterized protein n=1 Tax=Tanacetum coccineum TaxID=301880 RepID=A0ABQ5DW81_9ASTR